MPKLKCDVCGNEKVVPVCCDNSMILKGDYLMCCCSDECGYQSIPHCCGQKMSYLD
jgi:hypothetical protein